MTQEQGVFLANRNVAEYIFDSAKLTGCSITLVETQMILNGQNVGHLSLHDILRVLNLRTAWNYMLATLGSEFDFDYLCKINARVVRSDNFECGKLRTKKAKPIYGTSYVPQLPVRQEVDAELTRLLSLPDAQESAFKLFLWMYKAHLFVDGNMRTGWICANRRLLEGESGILTIKGSHIKEFKKRLTSFCEAQDTYEDASLEQWLCDNCLVSLS